MVAAVLLSCRAVIVVIFPPFDAVGFAGHTGTAAPADEDTGEQINCFLLWRCSGIQMADTLNKVKVHPVYNGFMGVRRANPFGGGMQLHGFQLIMRRPALALHQ